MEASAVQQRSTATTAPSNTFGIIHMYLGQREQRFKRILRGVRDEEVAGSNPVTPTALTRGDAARGSPHRGAACLTASLRLLGLRVAGPSRTDAHYAATSKLRLGTVLL